MHAVTQTLVGMLEEDMGSQAATVSPLRGFAYQAVGSMAQRVPQLLGGRTDIAQLFFRGEPAACCLGEFAWGV